MSESFAQSPESRADKENCHWNDQARRGRHQTVDPYSLAVSLARASQDCEGRHVSCEKRKEENHRTNRTVGKEKVLSIRLGLAKRNAANDSDDDEVDGDDYYGNHQCLSVSIAELPVSFG